MRQHTATTLEKTITPRAGIHKLLSMEIERVLTGMPGIAGVTCTFDHGGNWQPQNMTHGAHMKLADQRRLVQSRAVKSSKGT
jgi:hypothetical protein